MAFYDKISHHHRKHMDHPQFVQVSFHDRPFDHFELPFELGPCHLDDLEPVDEFHIGLHFHHGLVV